jgi:hypothetical protein
LACAEAVNMSSAMLVSMISITKVPSSHSLTLVVVVLTPTPPPSRPPVTPAIAPTVV